MPTRFRAIMTALLVMFAVFCCEVATQPLAPDPVPRDDAPLALRLEVGAPALLAPAEPSEGPPASRLATRDRLPPLTALSGIHNGEAVNGPGVRPGPA